MDRELARFPYQVSAVTGLAAGGVYSFGLPPVLLPLFILPYFLIFVRSPKTISLKSSLKISAVFFFCLLFTVLIWFLDTDVTLLAGLGSRYASLFLGLCLVIMASVLTLACLPLGFVMYRLQNQLKTPSLGVLLVIASAWVVIEWLRSLVFAIFLYAPGASIGDYWNFGSLGLGLISSPVGYLSRFVGMYGLSGLAVMYSLCLVWAFDKSYKPLLLLLGLTTIGSIISYTLLVPDNTKPPISASVLQREGSFADLDGNGAAIKYLDESPKDLIVLNEYSTVHLAGNEAFSKKYVENRLSAGGISLDVFANFASADERHSALETRGKNGKIVDSQTKQLLIPTGEYLPAILQLFYKTTGQSRINSSFAESRKLLRGQPPRVIHSEHLAIAPVACSGILGRNIYRQLVNDGGQVLTNSASLLIFNNSRSYFRQSLQMARFHAIANNRTYIQASMGASAFVIDSDGNYIIAPEDKKTAFVDFEFQPSDYKTPYTRFGEWPLLASGVVLAGFTGLGFQKRIKNRRKV